MSAVRGGGTALLRDLADGRWVVGAAAASIVVWNCALRELPVSLPLVVAVFAATVVIYGLDAWLDRRSAPLPPAIGLSLPLALLLLVATLPFLRGMTCLALAIGLPICARKCPIWRIVSGAAPRCGGSRNRNAMKIVAPAAATLAQNGSAPSAIAIAPPVTAESASPAKPNRQATSSKSSVSPARPSLSSDS